MARPVILCSGPWADLPLAELVSKASDWGYQALEISCWGDHFEVQRALSEAPYCQHKLDLLARHDLTVAVLANRWVGHAVSGPVHDRLQPVLPDYVWGDGQAEGVHQRAAEEMMATARAAQKLGLAVLVGGAGLSLQQLGEPPIGSDALSKALAEFVRQWNPILDVCRDCGVKFALEVQPGQVAFDLYSAEMLLNALDGREELGFTFDPSPLHWQGLDPVEFLRRFPDRIFHVHARDAVVTLNGRSGILNSYLPSGDPRRGWEFRAPGHGGIDWEAVVRGLNEINYDGPLSVEYQDSGMDRDFGAEDACKFMKRIDFEPARRRGDGAFREA